MYKYPISTDTMALNETGILVLNMLKQQKKRKKKMLNK